ncbi:hypothetical protein C8R44DRAFT_783140 [Mycena epipterygia]|nr:hypothetical protein C8R44DRAFT_783140 [Mycena epipterygia]
MLRVWDLARVLQLGILKLGAFSNFFFPHFLSHCCPLSQTTQIWCPRHLNFLWELETSRNEGGGPGMRLGSPESAIPPAPLPSQAFFFFAVSLLLWIP